MIDTTTYPFHRLVPSSLEIFWGEVLGKKGFAVLDILEEGSERASLNGIELVVLD